MECHPFFDDGNFLDIHTFADLPASGGMGSSSSFTVGMLNNLYLLNSIYKTPESLSTEAINVERNMLKEAGGWQDQIFSAYGGFNRIDFFNDSFSVTPLVLSPEKFNALEASCMLFFTNKLRSSKDIQDDITVVRNEGFPVNRPSSEPNNLSGDCRSGHGYNLDRQRKLTQRFYEL